MKLVTSSQFEGETNGQFVDPPERVALVVAEMGIVVSSNLVLSDEGEDLLFLMFRLYHCIFALPSSVSRTAGGDNDIPSLEPRSGSAA